MDPTLGHRHISENSDAAAAACAAASDLDASNVEAYIMPGMSKYDFVKIRVHLGSHYYVLSRFLVSRMLQVNGNPRPCAQLQRAFSFYL